MLQDQIKILESDCRFLQISEVSQHLIRYQCNVCDVIFGPEEMLNLSSDKLFQACQDIYNSGHRDGDYDKSEYKIFHMLKPKKDGIYINWGAGSNDTASVVKQEGYTLINYDPGIPDSLGYISRDSLQLLKVDGIISNNLLDHLQNPIEELLFMKSILNKEASMIHASDGFKYDIPFTKFHLFFFVGKSVEYVSRAIKMNYKWIPSNHPNYEIVRFDQP